MHWWPLVLAAAAVGLPCRPALAQDSAAGASTQAERPMVSVEGARDRPVPRALDIREAETADPVPGNQRGTGGQRPRPATSSGPRAEPALAIAGLVSVGYAGFSATKSLEAVYGTANGFIWGGGVRVTHRMGWFAQVAASRYSADGQRVFIADGQVFPLGIASHLTVSPVDITGGWRFRPRQPTSRPGSRAPSKPRRFRVAPFLGGGIGIVRLTEQADFAQGNDDVSSSHTSYHVLGGMDVPLHRWVGVGVEAGWRWVPDALIGDGVAKEFGETTLDHFFISARVTIGR